MWVVFDLWPFFSSLLPTFIPLGPLLLISHSLTVTHVPLVLCFPITSSFCSLKRYQDAATESWHALTSSCRKRILSNYCPCHQNNLYMELHGTELNCHLARCSINKNPHGQTRLIKGPVSCTKCVVKSSLVNSLLSGTKASVFFLKFGVISIYCSCWHAKFQSLHLRRPCTAHSFMQCKNIYIFLKSCQCCFHTIGIKNIATYNFLICLFKLDVFCFHFNSTLYSGKVCPQNLFLNI